MKVLEMEVAIMKHCRPRVNLTVPNVSWGMDLHECDVLSLTKSGYATEFEIKVSAYDLKKDALKRHGHRSKKIKFLYFVVPEKLMDLALEFAPVRAGVMLIMHKQYPTYNTTYVKIIRKARANPQATKWSEKQRLQLARLGALRILPLKEVILQKQREKTRMEPQSKPS